MRCANRRWYSIPRCTLIALAAASFFAHSRPCRADDPPSNRVATPLRGEFTIGKDGRLILLPVTIGSKTVSCLVDTGASLSLFDTTLIHTLGPPQGGRDLQTAVARIRVNTYGWPDAKLGGQNLRTVQPVGCLDLGDIRRATNESIYGVIGIDVLRTCPVQIDFDKGVLRFLASVPERDDSLGTRIPVRFGPDGAPRLQSLLGSSRSERLLIDTGAQGNSLADDVFDALEAESHIRTGTAFSSITVAGPARGQRGRLDTISIGPLAHEELRFSRLNYSSLGLRFFSRYLVTFDFPSECIYLRRGKHHFRREPDATSGLTLTWIEGSPVVESVRQDGPGSIAGLKPSDRLVRIDGKDAAEYDHFALRELLTSQASKKVSLSVRRGSRLLDFTIVLASD